LIGERPEGRDDRAGTAARNAGAVGPASIRSLLSPVKHRSAKGAKPILTLIRARRPALVRGGDGAGETRPRGGFGQELRASRDLRRPLCKTCANMKSGRKPRGLSPGVGAVALGPVAGQPEPRRLSEAEIRRVQRNASRGLGPSRAIPQVAQLKPDSRGVGTLDLR